MFIYLNWPEISGMFYVFSLSQGVGFRIFYLLSRHQGIIDSACAASGL
tara:strand:+ start:637 stop:780 length:144 start_codon:yes stop_codon:yes gene_type:complete